MWRKQTAQGVLWIREHEGCWGWQRRKTSLLWLMHVAFHSTHRKGYQCKLFVDSKSGRCNFWDFLLCDDRRSRWWASRDGPQHDRSRSDTVMISMHFNSYASLAIFFISFLFFSAFFFEHEPIYAIRVLTELIFITVLQLAWKPSIFGPSISFCLWIFVSAHAIVT